MSHWPYVNWPYIVGAYAIAIVVMVGFSLSAWLRLRRARRRLALIDPRARRGRAGS